MSDSSGSWILIVIYRTCLLLEVQIRFLNFLWLYFDLVCLLTIECLPKGFFATCEDEIGRSEYDADYANCILSISKSDRIVHACTKERSKYLAQAHTRTKDTSYVIAGFFLFAFTEYPFSSFKHCGDRRNNCRRHEAAWKE